MPSAPAPTVHRGFSEPLSSAFGGLRHWNPGSDYLPGASAASAPRRASRGLRRSREPDPAHDLGGVSSVPRPAPDLLPFRGVCLAISGRVVAIVDDANRLAEVEIAGVRRTVNVGLLDQTELDEIRGRSGGRSATSSPIPAATR
jgi:hypothetical protein